MIRENNKPTMESLTCPVPIGQAERILLGHGSGGNLTHNLVRNVFYPRFDNPALAKGNDAACLPQTDRDLLAISTDSHVVKPIIFPGGDIGRLAVCGTVNDVSMLGAVPLYLTAGFILEEGLEISTLEQIADSMQQAAREAGVVIVAGDTKVVEKGSADGIYITTTGIGRIRPGWGISGSNASPGDVVIVSGPLGDHGIAVVSARGDLGLETDVKSDVAPLNHLVEAMLSAADSIHVLRDPTRGGLATTLNEIAGQSGVGIDLNESKIPIRNSVRSACEVLGFDPLYLANEGRLIAIVPEVDSENLLMAMRSNPLGTDATPIGRVTGENPGRVLMTTEYGSKRVLDMLSGEMLPRIC